jgi:hypothetical protein
MFKKFQYDIAFSVAYQELDIAQNTAFFLKSKAITYYLFSEHEGRQWGENLFEETLKVYGRRSRIVLLIASNKFYENRWTHIEREIVEIKKRRKSLIVLTLRLPDSPPDRSGQIYVDWKNNPEKIADLLEEKLISVKHKNKKRAIRHIFLLSVFVIAAVLILLKGNPKTPKNSSAIIDTPQTFDSGNVSPQQGKIVLPKKPKSFSEFHEQDSVVKKNKDTILKDNEPGTITVEGLVVDSETGLPLDSVDIFINNTPTVTIRGKYTGTVTGNIGDKVEIAVNACKEGYLKQEKNPNQIIERKNSKYLFPKFKLVKI